MAEEKKKKKPRKQRKDKGVKRKPTYIGAFREKEGRPTMRMEVLASGSSGLTGAKLGKVMSGKSVADITSLLAQTQARAAAIAQRPPIDYASIAQQEIQKYFNQPSTEIVQKPDIAQAQEEQQQHNNPDYESAAMKLQRAAMSSKIQRLRTEADEAKADLAQLGEINAEMLQQIEEKRLLADELTRSIYEKEYYAQQYQKKARYEEIMRTTGSSKDIKKYYGIDLQASDIHDFRIQLLEEEDIPYELPERGLRGAPRKPIFSGQLPEGTGGSYVTDLQAQMSQLEMERGQMEDQLGGLHDTVRELKMMNEDAYTGHLVSDAIFGAINDLTTEEYERKVQEARASEEHAYGIALSKQEELAQKEQQYQQLLGQAEEEYRGLASQMEREGLTAQEQRMALEAEIRTLKESRDAEIAQGLALKNAETARLEESIRTLERGNEDLQAQMRRLQDDIDFKKQQMEGAVTKKEADELRKEIGRLGKELKFARDQSSKGDAMIIKQQKEKMVLEQALTVARTPQKGQEEEEETSAVASVRQAMGARIENLRTREERQAEQMAQLEEQFDEERQALKARIIEAESQRDLIAQTALQAEQEYNEEARVSNLEFEKVQRELAREGLMSMFFENELKRSGQEALKQDLKRQLEVQTAQADLAVSEYAKTKQKMTIELQRKAMGNLEKKLESALERKDFYKELATPPISPPLSRQVSEDTLVSDILYEPTSASVTQSQPKKKITPKVAKRENLELVPEQMEQVPEKKARPPLPPKPKKSVTITEPDIASGGGGMRIEDMSLQQLEDKFKYYKSMGNEQKTSQYSIAYMAKQAQEAKAEEERLKSLGFKSVQDMSDEELSQRIRKRRNSDIPSEREKIDKYRREIKRREDERELREHGFQKRMAAEQQSFQQRNEPFNEPSPAQVDLVEEKKKARPPPARVRTSSERQQVLDTAQQILQRREPEIAFQTSIGLASELMRGNE